MASSSDVVVRGSHRHKQALMARLYQKHFHDVWRWVGALGVRSVDLRDVVHDVFMAAWQSLDRFEGRSSHRTWLFSITSNVALNHRARAYLRREVLESSDTVGDREADHDTDHEAAVSEARRLLEAMLAPLPEEQRVTFLLFELGGMTGAAIAEVMGVPVQTVFSRLRAAREQVERESARYL